MDTPEEEFKRLANRLNECSGTVCKTLSVASPLDPGLADEYICELAIIGNDYRNTHGSWQIRPDAELQDKSRKVQLVHGMDIIDSLIARLELSRSGDRGSSDRQYILNCRSDAIQPADTETAVSDYHDAVKRYLAHQRDIAGVPITRTPRNKISYARLCESILFTLDEAASQIFSREIVTPANFDVKERNPHQFLGEINVGFENTFPNLLRVIAHEGPFGHNTHEMISKHTPFNGSFGHCKEGLAVLGEEFALRHNYAGNPGMKALCDLLMAKRVMNDALGAAFERLAFLERKSEVEMADALHSPIMDRKYLLARLKDFDAVRDFSVSTGATPYYVGYKKIKKIYDDCVVLLSAMMPAEEAKNSALDILFYGDRSAETMRLDMEFHCDCRKKNGKPEPEKSLDFSI